MNTEHEPRASTLNADIVILSAGASRRLGVPKQHVMFMQQSLLMRTCDLAMTFTEQQTTPVPPLIVVGPYADQDRRALAKYSGCEIVANDEWQQGLHRSLACAIQARRDSTAVLVLLVDQYRLSIQDLQQLHARWQQDPTTPAAAAFANTVGPPVIWPANYFADLLTLTGAAKALLESGPLHAIDIPAAAFDLDVPADLATLGEFEIELAGTNI